MPFKLLAAALLILTVVAGCGGGESNVAKGNRDGILHYGNGSEPQGLDPHVVTGVPENKIIRALFEGLAVKNPYTLEPEPGVAERWDISEDGTVVTFHINPQARWSNGDSVTAHDYVWSWERALNPAMGNLYAYMLFPIVNAEAYAKGELEDFTQVGVQARLMSHAMRKITGNIGKSGCTVIFLNQLRQKIGVTYGSPETTTGGNALKFYSSVRLDIRRIQTLKKGTEEFGIRAKVKVAKNKVAPPFRIAEFDIIFGQGISSIGCLVDLAEKHDIIVRKGAWYSYKGENISQGRDNAILYLKENAEVLATVESEVVQKLVESGVMFNRNGAEEAIPASTDSSASAVEDAF